jgi:hypothetical protein
MSEKKKEAADRPLNIWFVGASGGGEKPSAPRSCV